MTEQFNVTVNLSTCNCSVCGIVYTLPCNFMEKRMVDHERFYCPNGHSQHFPGKSKEQERIEHLEGAFDEMDDMYEQEKAEHQKAKNKIAYLKRKVKK